MRPLSSEIPKVEAAYSVPLMCQKGEARVSPLLAAG